MLVFFDPWHAGVVLPTLHHHRADGDPVHRHQPEGERLLLLRSDRKCEILTFFLGFHILWVSLIIIGTFLRGPGWNWFWSWEKWDPHKVEAMTNVDLPYLLGVRDYLWSSIFGGAARARLLRRRHARRCTSLHRPAQGRRSSWRAGACRASSPPRFLFLNMLAVVDQDGHAARASTSSTSWVTPWLNI